MKLTAKKSFGQNFLINPHIIDKIVTTAKISKNDTVIEIGPGTGNLTKKLVEQAGKVIAIEKDHRLIELLQETLKNYSNVEIIEDDILKYQNDLDKITEAVFSLQELFVQKKTKEKERDEIQPYTLPLHLYNLRLQV